jgi:HSP20 family protein
MAQSQAKPQQETASAETRSTNVPAAQTRRGQLAPREMTPWSLNPFSLMRRLSEDMDQMFGQLAGSVGAGSSLSSPALVGPDIQWIPVIDISERDGKLIVQADLPGIAPDDVTVEVDDRVLTLSGERREEREVDRNGVRRTERRYGRFSRSIVLPEGAQTDDIQASFRNGVLEIAIPVSKPESQRRTVNIQSGSGDGGATKSAEAGQSGGGNGRRTS